MPRLERASEPWTIVSLFDWSGNWSRPYREAGYPVMQFDKLLGGDLMDFDYRKIPQGSVRGILIALPCTHFARVAALHWKAMDADGRTAKSIALAQRVLEIVKFHQPHWWVLENPEGRLPNLMPEIGRLRLMAFDPKEFGDPYTKRTALFGHFNPLTVRTATTKWIQGRTRKDHAIDKFARQHYPGIPRQAQRSITPMGFARAFFQANP